MALGSVAELETQLLLSVEFEFLLKDDLSAILSDTDKLGKMLRSLSKSLKRSRT